MEYTNIKVWLILILTFGLLLVGFGITGNIVYNGSTLSDHCNADKDCINGKICCYYYETFGVCQEPQICEEIKQAIDSGESPLKKNYAPYAINLGLALICIVVILLYIIYISESKGKKKRKK